MQNESPHLDNDSSFQMSLGLERFEREGSVERSVEGADEDMPLIMKGKNRCFRSLPHRLIPNYHSDAGSQELF